MNLFAKLFGKRRAKKNKPVPVPVETQYPNPIVRPVPTQGRFVATPIPQTQTARPRQAKTVRHWDDEVVMYADATSFSPEWYGLNDVSYSDSVSESASKTSDYDGYTHTPESTYNPSPSFSEPSTPSYEAPSYSSSYSDPSPSYSSSYSSGSSSSYDSGSSSSYSSSDSGGGYSGE